jgi:hypothetical protein
MMKRFTLSEQKEIARSALLLAVSGLSDRALRNLVEFLSELGPSASLEYLTSLKYRVLDRLDDRDVRDYEVRMSKPLQSAAAEVLRLLTIESALPAQVAAKRLEDAIKSSRPTSFKLPPFRSKQGIVRWLNALSEIIPPSELLHHATAVRNMAVHSDAPDWPLKPRGK